MIVDKPETESLAALQVVAMLATELRKKGLLSLHELEGALKATAFAMHNSEDERVQAAARLVDETRVQIMRS